MRFEDLVHQGILKLEYYQQGESHLTKRYHIYLANLVKIYLKNSQDTFFNNNSISADKYEEYVEEILTLKQMGFGNKLARKALEIIEFDLQDAIDWLLDGEGKTLKEEDLEEEEEEETEEYKYNENLEIEKAKLASIDPKQAFFSNISESTFKHNSLL
jgi:hypothetical protein